MSSYTVLHAIGFDLYATMNDESIKKFVSTQTTRVKDLYVPNSMWGKYMTETHIPGQFAQAGAPSPWPELSPRYARWKAKHYPGAPLLVRTKTMYAGFSYVADKNELKIENKTAYANYHQTGTRKMPARKWLQLIDQDYNEYRRIIRNYVLYQAGGEFAWK